MGFTESTVDVTLGEKNLYLIDSLHMKDRLR